MAETRFTPGPWIAERIGGPGNQWNVMAELTGQVCRVAVAPGYGQREANARLIAASPDLYAACEAIVARLDYLSNLWGQEGVTRSLQDQVRAALAKARGEEVPGA